MDNKNNEIIKGVYYVADCEHYGDVERGMAYLRSLGCKIISDNYRPTLLESTTIEFSFNSSDFKHIHNELYDSAAFSRNINDFYPIEKSYITTKEYKNKRDLAKNHDLEVGFEKKMPIECFFELKERDKDKKEEIIKAILGILGKGTKLEAKMQSITDGNTFVTLLIYTPYANVRNCKKVGDYCLGHEGWLKNNTEYGKIYGECRCISHLMNIRCSIYQDKYELFENKVKEIMKNSIS